MNVCDLKYERNISRLVGMLDGFFILEYYFIIKKELKELEM